MTWHDEREPAVYAPGERTAELEAKAQPKRWIEEDFYRSLVGRQATISRNGEQITICSFDAQRGYTVGFDDGSIDYFYRPDELSLPHRDGRCNACAAPGRQLCVRGCPNADPTAPGQPGHADALAEHFEFACRGCLLRLNRMRGLGLELSNEAIAWLGVEEKRTAGR